MGLVSIIFFGWYRILDKTIYSIGARGGGIGPKEHSFFITFLVHGINLDSILTYLGVTFYNRLIPLYLALSSAVLVFIVGYFFFFKKKTEDVIAVDLKPVKTILFVIIALTYVVLSFYLMIKVGDYAREMHLKGLAN